jgi:hypothetical protein
MGHFTKVEDRPTPKCVYNWRVYGLAAMAGSAAIMIGKACSRLDLLLSLRSRAPQVHNANILAGYDSAFIGTTIALPSFKAEFKMTHLSSSAINLLSANIVSCYQAGAFFGAIFAYLAAFFLGRTSGLAVFSAIFTLGAGLMLGANGERGLGLIYAGRVLAGKFCLLASIVCADLSRDRSWRSKQPGSYLHRRDLSTCHSGTTCLHVRTWMANWWLGWLLDQLRNLFTRSKNVDRALRSPTHSIGHLVHW